MIRVEHVIQCMFGRCDGAMVLGKLPVPGGGGGVLQLWIRVGQGPTVLAVGAGGGGGGVGHFFSRLSFLFSFSLPLGDGLI